MKVKKIKLTVIFLILAGFFAAIGCDKIEKPVLCVSFEEFTFQKTYLSHFQDENTFFIKGIALNTNRHGREIKVVEYLKGNFSGKSNVFVWGASDTSTCSSILEQLDMRVDFITQYQRNDTLIMLVTPARRRFNGDVERSGNYATFGNGHHSVVRLSNGYVTGVITHPWIETMPLEDFKALLNSTRSSEFVILK